MNMPEFYETHGRHQVERSTLHRDSPFNALPFAHSTRTLASYIRPGTQFQSKKSSKNRPPAVTVELGLATARAPPLAPAPSPVAPGELQLEADDEFLEFQRRENQENQPGELQLVLAPEFL
jgi:hypothetical protein